MFNTIKSKIILTTSLMFVILCLVLAGFSALIYQQGKFIVRRGCGYNIAIFKEKINKEIIELESSASDLALLGSVYFESRREKTLAENMLINIFNGYPMSLGGGIWFEPYEVNKNKRLFCIYAFRDKKGTLKIDNSFESEAYNYPHQRWYTDIKHGLEREKTVAWSGPYYESQGSDTLMVTVGAGIYNNDKLVGISTIDWEISSIIDSISKMAPTQNSFALFADKTNDYILASTDKYMQYENLLGKSLKAIPWYSEYTDGISTFKYHGKKYISYADVLDNGMILIINVPEIELFRMLIENVLVFFLILFSIMAFISSLLYKVLTVNIMNPIDKLTNIANKIRQGSLDTEIKIEKPEEFERLAATFDMMTKDIKSIMHEKEHYLSELQIAKDIQKSSLPSVFPPFPDRKEFDIYASMEAATEVGGDFYDFYFISPKKLIFLIADVSGKGIPACLCMMRAKTIVNNISKFEYSPKELIESVNKIICETNKQGFFVTMLIGIIDVKTGKLSFINCGHNPPLLRRNGKFEYIKMDTNLVLGMVDDFEYNIHEMQLQKDDMIFMYTDGITEARSDKDELFGEERLAQCLNNRREENVSKVIENVKTNLHGFTKDMPQSDDMTMLAFKYNGTSQNNVEVFKCKAEKENFKLFDKWLLDTCEEWSIPQSRIMNIELSCEEVYTNIISYGYPESNAGDVEIKMTKGENFLQIDFTDDGIEYNPLEKADPDINLSIDERDVGGLGIFMVKQMVDDIKYSRENNMNILTLTYEI